MNHLGLYGQTNKRTIQSCFVRKYQSLIKKSIKYYFYNNNNLFYKLQYNTYAVTSPSNNFAIT